MSFFRFVIIRTFDRRTDGHIDSSLMAIPRLCSCSAVKHCTIDYEYLIL